MNKILAGCILLMMVLFVYQECDHRNTESALIKSFNDSMKVYIDKNGNTHAEAMVREYTQYQLETMAKYDEDMAALKEQVKNFKNLQSHTIYTYHYMDTVRSATYDTVFADGSQGKTFQYFDTWSNMKGILYKDSVTVRYSLKDKLKLTTFWKREKWYKPKVFVVDVTNTNPHVKPDGLTHMELKQEKKFYETTAFKFGAGLVGGAVLWKYMSQSKR